MITPTAGIVLALFGALATLVVILARGRSERRERETGEALGRAGFETRVPRDEIERGGVYERLGPARYLAGGSSGVRWWSRGLVEGRGVTLVLHRSSVDRDDHVEFVHTMVAAAECPGGWPGVRVVPRSVGRGAPGMVLENAEFSAGFRVDTLDDDFALLVLTPRAQEMIVELAREHPDPVVALGEGVLAVIVPGPLDAGALIGLARRTGELRGAMEPV